MKVPGAPRPGCGVPSGCDRWSRERPNRGRGTRDQRPAASPADAAELRAAAETPAAGRRERLPMGDLRGESALGVADRTGVGAEQALRPQRLRRAEAVEVETGVLDVPQVEDPRRDVEVAGEQP